MTNITKEEGNKWYKDQFIEVEKEIVESKKSFALKAKTFSLEQTLEALKEQLDIFQYGKALLPLSKALPEQIKFHNDRMTKLIKVVKVLEELNQQIEKEVNND